VIKNKFTVLGEISQRMGNDVILVGGGAVELYTKGWYTTGDLDVITTNRKRLITLLMEMGYERVSERHFLKDEIFIDIVGSYFDRHSDEVAIKGTDLKVRVISIEDIIIDRLCACIHWASAKDCEQADYLLSSYFKQIDMDYLMKRADAEQVLEKLEEIVQEVSQDGPKPARGRRTKVPRKHGVRKVKEKRE
jgi:hypothetical protein